MRARVRLTLTLSQLDFPAFSLSFFPKMARSLPRIFTHVFPTDTWQTEGQFIPPKPVWANNFLQIFSLSFQIQLYFLPKLTSYETNSSGFCCDIRCSSDRHWKWVRTYWWVSTYWWTELTEPTDDADNNSLLSDCTDLISTSNSLFPADDQKISNKKKLNCKARYSCVFRYDPITGIFTVPAGEYGLYYFSTFVHVVVGNIAHF